MRNPAFVALIDEVKALHESKNSDYAHDADPLSNLRKCEAFGVPALTGVLVRLTDKWSRIEQLAGGKIPKHESLRDSLIDNAVYSLLAVILMDEHRPSLDVEVKPRVDSIFTGAMMDESDYDEAPLAVGPAGYMPARKMGR